MISLKDYAQKYGVSYEAIRTQVKRYEEELKGHIILQNRTRYLDSFSEDFLDKKRNINPVIVYEQENREELEDMKRALGEMQAKLISCHEKIEELQTEKIALIEERGKAKYLLEASEKKEQELQEAKKEIEELKAEANRFKKTIFGLYKKE